MRDPAEHILAGPAGTGEYYELRGNRCWANRRPGKKCLKQAETDIGLCRQCHSELTNGRTAR